MRKQKGWDLAFILEETFRKVYCNLILYSHTVINSANMFGGGAESDETSHHPTSALMSLNQHPLQKVRENE